MGFLRLCYTLPMSKFLIFNLSLLLWFYSASVQQQHVQPDLSEYTCMLAVLYSEARGEQLDGVHAVASVVINRRNLASLYSKSICGVVFQHKQFSNVLYTYRKVLEQPRSLQNDKGYTKVATIAYEASYGAFKPSVQALDYHAVAIRPYWSQFLKDRRVIGGHVFGVVQSPNRKV